MHRSNHLADVLTVLRSESLIWVKETRQSAAHFAHDAYLLIRRKTWCRHNVYVCMHVLPAYGTYSSQQWWRDLTYAQDVKRQFAYTTSVYHLIPRMFRPRGRTLKNNCPSTCTWTHNTTWRFAVKLSALISSSTCTGTYITWRFAVKRSNHWPNQVSPFIKNKKKKIKYHD